MQVILTLQCTPVLPQQTPWVPLPTLRPREGSSGAEHCPSLLEPWQMRAEWARRAMWRAAQYPGRLTTCSSHPGSLSNSPGDPPGFCCQPDLAVLSPQRFLEVMRDPSPTVGASMDPPTQPGSDYAPPSTEAASVLPLQLPNFINTTLPPHEQVTAQEIDSYFRQELIHKRNERMGKRVMALLRENEDKICFFAFGAGLDQRGEKHGQGIWGGLLDSKPSLFLKGTSQGPPGWEEKPPSSQQQRPKADHLPAPDQGSPWTREGSWL